MPLGFPPVFHAVPSFNSLTLSSPSPWPLALMCPVFSLWSKSLPYLIYSLVSTWSHHALNGGPSCQLNISIWRHIKLRISGTHSSSISLSLPLLSLAKPCSSCNFPPLMATTSMQLLRPKFLESSLIPFSHILYPILSELLFALL